MHRRFAFVSQVGGRASDAEHINPPCNHAPGKMRRLDVGGYLCSEAVPASLSEGAYFVG